MKQITVILDPAHGSDVPGKRSPDGAHLEYRWSRERINSLRNKLKTKGYDVLVTTESETEPGLSRRRSFATSAKGNNKLLLSLHNDAAGNGTSWMSAEGASVFTTKGVTISDTCAEIILKGFEKNFPDIKIRKFTNTPLNRDFEENFTVLSGSGYYGVLVEWLFQDNKKDVEKLLDPKFNERFETSLVESIEEINNYFSTRR